MKYFNRTAISAALVITLATAFSVNAKAEESTSNESKISEMVIAQGKQVISDLSLQLQQTISEEINSFSINFSFDEATTESMAWLTEHTQESEVQMQASQPQAN